MANSSMRSQLYYWKQSTFAGGEVSPDLYARDDLEKYASSCQKAKNFFAHPFGGISNRAGTQFLDEAGDSSSAVRIIPFIFSQTQAYIIELGDGYLKAYTTDGVIEDFSLDTPYSSDDLFEIHYTQSADTLILCHRDYQPRILARTSSSTWTLTEFTNLRGPFQDENTDDTTITPSGTTGSITLTASDDVFSEDMVDSLIRISHEVYAQSVHYSGSSLNTTDSILVNGDWDFQITDPYEATFTIQVSNDLGTTWETLKTYSCTDSSSAISDSGSTDHLQMLRVYSTASSDGSGAYTLSATAFVNDGICTITAYTSATEVTATVYTNDNKYVYGLASTDATTFWALGAWSEDQGYPRCCTFYQDRLVFASTTEQPLNLFFSRTGDYTDFYQHSVSDDNTTYDDDGIVVQLISSAVNAVENLVSLGALLAFTAGGNWKITSSGSGSAITPTNISAVQQSYRGASSVAPVVLDTRALYVSATGNVVRDFAYDVYSDTFKGTDVSVYSKHLFRNHSIVDWAYQATPDNIVWAVRDDGVLLSLTYMYDEKVVAWCEHETDGTVESVAAIPGDLQDRLFLVVNRTIDGDTKRYVELMYPRLESTDPTKQYFLDCALSINDPLTISAISTGSSITLVTTSSAHGLAVDDIVSFRYMDGCNELDYGKYTVTAVESTTQFGIAVDSSEYDSFSSGYCYQCHVDFSGLDHLEGKTVTVHGDGGYSEQLTVSDGAVTTSEYLATATVGLTYIAYLKTMDLSIPRQDGTSTYRNKAIKEVAVSVKDSQGGLLGLTDFDSMMKLPVKMGAVYGVPAGLETKTTRNEPANTGFEPEAYITIKQEEPMPLTILALTAAIEME